MTRRVFLWVSVLGLLWTACGKKGPLALPVPRIPQAVEDFDLIQRGQAVYLAWSLPSAYLDGKPLKEVAACEIWVVEDDRSPESPPRKWTAAEFEARARLLESLGREGLALLRQKEGPGPPYLYTYSPPAEDLGRKVLTFSLRARDEKNRTSEFAEPRSLRLGVPPPPPAKVRALAGEDHVHLTWDLSPGAAGYNVYRAEGEGRGRLVNSSPVKDLEYKDKEIAFGVSLLYRVRAIAESEPELESDDSEAVTITPLDIFPPAAPAGLTIISGAGFIALSWEANTESDLAGYKVWRREAGGGEFTLRVVLPPTGSSFSDREVEKDRRYDYSISALDSAGNESPRSSPVSGIMRESPS